MTVVNVLVVEDSPAVGRMLVTVLEQAGHKVRWVQTGAEAVTAAKGWAVEVVLLDMHLADTDGLTVAAELRSEKHAKGARIIGLSGDPVSASEERGLDRFLLKPVSFTELLAAVRG